ncbi:50S ribosomal protein L2 [Candidatus Uhrbacteria bacterium]|nr:50S ribosomal protein L2 [Candidatus Uhrbacteria bacterium]
MGIKVYNKNTAGRRFSSVQDFSDVTKMEPVKSLVMIKKRMGGRNAQGKITVRHQGGGARRYIRMVDFKHNRFDVAARVAAIEYDPNRGARIALLEYPDGEKRYVLAPLGVTVGHTIMASHGRIEARLGNRMPLSAIPIGTIVHNIELIPGAGGVAVRAAGMGAQVMAVDGGYAHLKFPSGEVRKVPDACAATVGAVGNPDWRHVRWGKAGRMRHRGIRPQVRGKVMNPVDHPHGGGEGKHPIGLKHAKTPWGKTALGVKTRRTKKWTWKMIVQRRK